MSIMHQSNSTVSGRIIDIDDLTSNQYAQMYELMDRYYSNVSENIFEKDLNEKDKVILLTEHENSSVCGFSTQVSFCLTGWVRPVRILFSGDTIIDQLYWHSNPLAGLWGKMVLDLMSEYEDHELYWLLLSKGFRTYRYLPVFFNSFYPRYNENTPELMRELITVAVRNKYPTRFDAEKGILNAKEYFLRSTSSGIEQGRHNNPHIRFFLESNPGFVRGDELCCIAPLTKDNLRRSAYRIIG